MTDPLREFLDENIAEDWRSGHRPVYRLFDQYTPHCQLAQPYREVGGRMRYRCRHDIERTADPTGVAP